jgi:hypothetical protein
LASSGRSNHACSAAESPLSAAVHSQATFPVGWSIITIRFLACSVRIITFVALSRSIVSSLSSPGRQGT